MVPWSHLRQPSSGWVSTVLNSEFTHFNLVIRLSKGQQSALRFISLFESPAAPIVPCDPRELHSSSVTLFETIRNLLLFAAASDDSWQQHLIQESGRHTTFRCGDSFFWWLSGEVKHFVHLIRWNLKAVLCQLGHDLTTVPVQGIIARTVGLGTESCF